MKPEHQMPHAHLTEYSKTPSTVNSYFNSPESTSEESELEPQNNLDNSACSNSCNCDECVVPDFIDKELLTEQLRSWAVKFTVPLNHVSSLLKILHDHKLRVPLDARTLLKTPRKVDISIVAAGTYSHLGVKSQISRILDTFCKTFAADSEMVTGKCYKISNELFQTKVNSKKKLHRT